MEVVEQSSGGNFWLRREKRLASLGRIYARKSNFKLCTTVTVDDDLYESLNKGSYTVYR